MVFDYDKLKTYDELPAGLTDVSWAVLDPNRKGNDYLSMPICRKDAYDEHYLVDILFKKTSTKYLIDEIVDKIIVNKVVLLSIESNTDTSLDQIIKQKLDERGYHGCVVVAKYSTENKEVKINSMKDLIKDKIHFPAKALFKPNTDMGQAMEQLTMYSFDFPVKHDDMPDSLSMYSKEIILEEAVPQKAKPMKRKF